MFFKKDPEKERKQSIKEENKRRKLEFKKTKSYIGLSVDEISKSFKIDNDFFKVFQFDELVDYNLIENGQTITQGGISLKRAAAGGILLGGAGMIVGGLTGKKKIEDNATEIRIEFKVKGLNEGIYEINLLSKPIKKDTYTYKALVMNAKEIISFFDRISNLQ